MSKFKTIQKAIVVGFGNIALRHRQNLKFLFPNIKIFGVSSSGKIPSKKEECIDQIYLRLEDAIKTNVDLAIIASPASLHFIHAKKLIEAKVPCLIEKPVTHNFQEGKTFWLSGFAGKNNTRTGPFNTYIYNNTIYTKASILSKIAVDKASKGVLVANNIFHVAGDSKLVLGDQYKPDDGGAGTIENVIFTNNLFLKLFPIMFRYFFS